MFAFEIPPDVETITKLIVKNTESQVIVQNVSAQNLSIHSGLKQGDGMAPTLSNKRLECVI